MPSAAVAHVLEMSSLEHVDGEICQRTGMFQKQKVVFRVMSACGADGSYWNNVSSCCVQKTISLQK